MEEIARLREQFKSLQQQESRHRLSERNCVELVTKLIAAGQLQVYFTQDGKEYITPEQLEHEIKDELLVRGGTSLCLVKLSFTLKNPLVWLPSRMFLGRVNVLDLQPVLNLDLVHIEAKIQELLKKDKRLRLLNGEIITR